jgi:multiple sugar transport system permease protein
MTAASTAVPQAAAAATTWRPRRRQRAPRIALYVFLTGLAVLWLVPILWTLYIALRPISDTTVNGYFSLPTEGLELGNFVTAWNQAGMAQLFLNTAIITAVAVPMTLWISSMLGFIFARFSFRANLLLLMMFTAGNLLPPQVIIVPLYRMYLALPLPVPLSDHGVLYDSYFGIILIHVIFQTGFCTFVLSNYMKTISRELTEAAVVDGASLWTTYRKIILPLTRPALAALATLEFTFIYNDFFWALMLMKSGDKRPVTSALNNLTGAFFTNYNLLAAAAFIVAVPTVVVYLLLSKQFVRGLTLGSTKG